MSRLICLLSLLLSIVTLSARAGVIITCSPANTIFKDEGVSLAAVAVDSQLTITGDATTLASATVTMNADAGAFLSFTNDGATMGNIAASYNGATGVLTMVSAGAMATVTQWQSALRTVTYNRSYSVAGNVTKTISFVVNDGAQNSMAAQKTILLAGGPLFMYPLETWGICENASATGIDDLLFTEDYIMGSTVNYSVVTPPLHGTVSLSGAPVVVNFTSFTASSITYTPDAGYVGADSIVFSVTDGINSSQMTVRVTMGTAPPQPGGIIGPDVDTVGPNPIRYTIQGPIDSNAAYQWTYSGSNIFIGGSPFAGAGPEADVSFFPYPTATDGILSVTASNVCGTSTASTKAITVQPIQFITFDSLDTTYYRGPDVTLDARSTSQLPLRFVVADPSVGAVGMDFTGRLVMVPINAGQTTVTAYQDGEGGLQPATPVTRVFVVGKADQFINFSLPISFVLGVDIAPTLNGTASSGLPLTYSSSNPRIATINGDQINWLDSGTVTITAMQGGDRNNNPAPDVQVTVNVLKPLPFGSIVYPNPSHGIFFFVPNFSFDARSYVLYNSSGQQVVAAPVVYSGFYREVRIQAGNAGPGIYLLKVFGRVNGKDTAITFKVLIL